MPEHVETRRVIDALTQLGWQIIFVRDPALVVKDREMPVGRIKAEQVGQNVRAMIVLFTDPATEVLALLGATPPTTAIGRIPDSPWSIHAEVVDASVAAIAGQRLGELLLGSSPTLEACVRALQSAGWMIDHHEETSLDDRHWDIRGARDAERLDVGILFHGNHSVGEGELRVEVDAWDAAYVRTRSASASVTVRSRVLAQELVDALTDALRA